MLNSNFSKVNLINKDDIEYLILLLKVFLLEKFDLYNISRILLMKTTTNQVHEDMLL